MNKFYNNNRYFANQGSYQQPKHKINNFIKAPCVRVISEGKQIGIMNTNSAQKLAQDKKLDLVELVPDTNPPVCHIINYEKYLYEQKIKEKSLKKNKNDLKEIRFKSCIEQNDLNIKINKAKSFLEDKKKLQITVKFKIYRDLSHKDRGFELIKKFIGELSDFGVVEKEPFVSSNQIMARIVPKN